MRYDEFVTRFLSVSPKKEEEEEEEGEEEVVETT